MFKGQIAYPASYWNKDSIDRNISLNLPIKEFTLFCLLAQKAIFSEKAHLHLLSRKHRDEQDNLPAGDPIYSCTFRFEKMLEFCTDENVTLNYKVSGGAIIADLWCNVDLSDPELIEMGFKKDHIITALTSPVARLEHIFMVGMSFIATYYKDYVDRYPWLKASRKILNSLDDALIDGDELFMMQSIVWVQNCVISSTLSTNTITLKLDDPTEMFGKETIPQEVKPMNKTLN